MKNIIIPVDFSIYSEYALKVAAKLAKNHGASLTLIHMLELPSGYSNHDSSYTKTLVFMIKFAEKKMEEFLQKSYMEGLEITVIIKHFTLFSEIGEIAEQNNSSLIVMGSHGKDYHSDSYLGSNTEKVVKNSKIPVIIIKQELDVVEFKNTVYVSDFKSDSIDAYKKAKTFFDLINVQPKLLFVNIPGGGFVSTKEMRQRFRTFLMEAEGNLDNLDNFANYDDYNIVDGVNNFVEENDISLISVATHGRSNISKFFNNSASIDLANKTILPVLTVLI